MARMISVGGGDEAKGRASRRETENKIATPHAMTAQVAFHP